MNNITGQIAQAAMGLFKWQVIDADGSVATEAQDWQKNLILNDGMNEVATRQWCNCFTHAIASTGVTPTSVSGGAITLTQAGQTVTASAGFFAAGDVGSTIKFNAGGVDALITAFGSSTSVTVDVSQTVAAPTAFTQFQTNQRGTSFNGANEERTVTYLTGVGNCGTSLFGVSTLQHRRTFDFPVQGTNKTYTEVGVGWSITTGTNTAFSRILIQGGSVLVQAGQRLRIIYQLNLALGPVAPKTLATTIIGWPYGASGAPSAVEQLQEIHLSAINVNGATVTYTGGANRLCLEPSFPTSGNLTKMFLNTVSTAPSAFNSIPVNRTGSAITNQEVAVLSTPAYVTNTFYQIQRAVWQTSDGNSPLIRSVTYGDSTGGVFTPNDYAYVLVWDNAQEKPNTHTLTINLRVSWSRVLN